MSSPLVSSLTEVSRPINVSDPPVSTVPTAMVLLTTILYSLPDKGNQTIIAVQKHGFGEFTHKNGDRSVADELAKKVRVLCMVMTQPSNHEKKAQHVKATWGTRCNKLLFMSTATDEDLPSIRLHVPKGRDFFWAKTKEAFRYVYDNHRKDADWFMMVDDDTYVVVENLRYMLSDHNSTDPVYFRCRYKSFTPQGYLSGGAGYILSRMALDRFVKYEQQSPHMCEANQLGAEGSMGICLEHIGLKTLDNRDSFGRDRFILFMPRSHLFPEKYDNRVWYWKYMYNPTDEGLGTCSDHAVSIHEVNPEDMYTIDFFIYHLRPYGIQYVAYTKTKESNKLKNKNVVTLPNLGY